MNPVRSGGEISYAVLEVIYDDRKVRQSAVHKCHAQLPCKCLARYQARPCLALRTALVHGKIPQPGQAGGRERWRFFRPPLTRVDLGPTLDPEIRKREVNLQKITLKSFISWGRVKFCVEL